MVVSLSVHQAAGLFFFNVQKFPEAALNITHP